MTETQRDREMYRQGWKDCCRALADALAETRLNSIILTEAEDTLLAAAAKAPAQPCHAPRAEPGHAPPAMPRPAAPEQAEPGRASAAPPGHA